jgi:peptidoglycan/LPS O-acetylase OafA/YrhL
MPAGPDIASPAGRPEIPPAVSPGPRVHRLPAIEVARGFASVWVLLFHSLATWPPEALHPALRTVRHFTTAGWLGVHVFFALSGWCIAERLAAAYRRHESGGRFLRERVLRIFPTYWAALALLLLTRLAAQPFNHTPLWSNLPAGPLGWCGDLLLLNPYVGAPATLIVSWSLVYELGFYALGALALLLRRRGISSAGLVATGLLLCAWPLLPFDSVATHVLRLWPDFFVGALVWWCARRRTAARTIIGLVGLGSLGGLVGAWPAGYGGSARGTAIATAAILWVAAGRATDSRQNPFLRAFAWLGACSYSLYLVHVTVLSPFLNLAQRFVPPDHLAFAAIWLVAVALGIGAGRLLYVWVEAPVERWRKTRWALVR